jgi:hypothetical protein
LMLNKKLIPVAIPLGLLVLLVAAMMSVGAQPNPSVHIPSGDIVESPNARMANDTPRRAVPAAPGLPAGQAGALTETFDGKTLDAWRGITDSPITWVAKDGRLQEYLSLADETSDDPALFVTKDSGFANGTVETYFYATGGGPVGIVLRGSDQGYYRVLLHMNVPSNTMSKARIERVTPDHTQVIAEAPISAFAGYDNEHWQLLQVSAQGNAITVSVDGRQIMSTTDGTLNDQAFLKGWAGVWAQADLGATFDNIRIQPSAVR